jgi:hypothetical protein
MHPGFNPYAMAAFAAPMPTAAYGPSVTMPMGHAGGGRATRTTQATADSENFVVFASDPEWAKQVAKAAEQTRQELAIHWLGSPLPRWHSRCPIQVMDHPNSGASGETRFRVVNRVASNWEMRVEGTRERILDSVLPHEISHTVLATHFARLNKYVPRWADEGSATTTEHEAEKSKHHYFLDKFLKEKRGIAFNRMFRMKDYPSDFLPLYAQGHSVVQFLLNQAGPRQFIAFLESGMANEDWPAALKKVYEYDNIGQLQVAWNKWVEDGSPTDLVSYSPLLQRRSHEGNRTVLALAGNNRQPSEVEVASDRASAGSAIQLDTSVQQASSNWTPSDSSPQSSLQLLASSDPTNPQWPGDPDRSRDPSRSAGLMSMEEAIQAAGVAAAVGASPAALQADSPVRQPNTYALSGQSQPATSSQSDSWYKRKLHQTSGSPATTVVPHNQFAGDPARDSASTQQAFSVMPADGPTAPPGHHGLVPMSTAPQSTAPMSITRPQTPSPPSIAILPRSPSNYTAGPTSPAQSGPWIR